MDRMFRTGNQAVGGFFRGAPQVVNLDVECTGVPKTWCYNILSDRTIRFQGQDHIQFDSMYVCTLKVVMSRCSRVRATKDAGIAAFGKNKCEGLSRSGSGGGGGGGGEGVSGWPKSACRQPPPVEDGSSSSSSDED